MCPFDFRWAHHVPTYAQRRVGRGSQVLRGFTEAEPGHPDSAPHRGAGFDIVPERATGIAALRAQCHTGLPREAPCGLFFRLQGRPPACHRRGRSPSINQRTTTPMVRRWTAGTPKRHSGPEGRCRRQVPQQQPEIPPIPNSPHSLGNAQPTSTTLTGRLEAHPHNARPTWCGSETEADQDPRVPATETRVRLPARSTPSGACSRGTFREARCPRGYIRRQHTSSGSVCRV